MGYLTVHFHMKVFKSYKGNLYYGKNKQDAKRLMATVDNIKSIGAKWEQYLQEVDTEYGSVWVIKGADLEEVTFNF